MTKKSSYVLMSEAVKGIGGAREFCKANRIRPTALVVLWWEKEAEG